MVQEDKAFRDFILGKITVDELFEARKKEVKYPGIKCPNCQETYFLNYLGVEDDSHIFRCGSCREEWQL